MCDLADCAHVVQVRIPTPFHGTKRAELPTLPEARDTDPAPAPAPVGPDWDAMIDAD